ncbi:hypothetical protein, partial [Methylogaea oryzae]|uniref:hypothetical protein n=1 Tax=Methylogaea oryzae TaxID=1295382 RepID=UPI00402BD0E9
MQRQVVHEQRGVDGERGQAQAGVGRQLGAVVGLGFQLQERRFAAVAGEMVQLEVDTLQLQRHGGCRAAGRLADLALFQ